MNRLYPTINPSHYSLTLTPNLKTFTFLGEETITFSVEKPTNELTFHSVEIEITKVELPVRVKDSSTPLRMTPKISYDEKNGRVTFSFNRKLKAGEYRLRLSYKGLLGEKMRGWYRSQFSVGGEKHYMATTQFEEIGARQAFICIDEPLAKAVFEISLTIPKNLTAISNTINKKIVEQPNGYKTVMFSPTPKMATYALAFIVGEFEFVEGVTTSGVRVRVYVTPGKKSQAQFTLGTALKMLPFYETYFDIPYPLPVLDFIAIPDFDAGAMENWGAITGREAAFLVDEKQTSAANKQWVVTVIAHELTHMWFGNLVTMKWWEDLWLNEGFASYMEYVGLNEIFPQWKVWEQFAILDHNRAMGLDSLQSTHPIQTKIIDEQRIAENFDEVSYSKGASVIQMLATYLGESDFRSGIRYYLKKYSYANAETKDLWDVLEKTSGKKIKKMMQIFTGKPGHPLIIASQSKSSLNIVQTRFFSSSLSRQRSKDKTVWIIPLTNQIGKEKKETIVMKTKTLMLPKVDTWIKFNNDELSFVRTLYDETLYTRLKKPIEEKLLSNIDRMGIFLDAFDCAESGYHSTANVLLLAESYKKETSYIVWANLSRKLGIIENLIQDKNTLKKFHAYGRDLFLEIGEMVGWEKKKTDSHEDILLRSVVLSSLGTYQDNAVIIKAKELFKKAVADKNTVDTDIRGVAYAIGAENGGNKEFEQLKKMYIEEELSTEKNRIGSAMCLFHDPRLARETLEFSLSNHVRNQDIGRFLVLSFGNRDARGVTWEFIKKNWDTLLQKMAGMSIDWMIKGTESVTDEKMAKDIKKFFRTHPHPKLEKAMQQVLEQIESNIAWFNRDRQAIENFLQKEV